MNAKGFTLVELMIVVVIIGILAALGVLNYIALRNRAYEASLKSNMLAFQVSTEDYASRNNALYATNASDVASLLKANFRNPFDGTGGNEQSWRDQPAWSSEIVSGTTKAGCVAYADSIGMRYQIAGRGATADLSLVLRTD